jgi:hypothetical protein
MSLSQPLVLVAPGQGVEAGGVAGGGGALTPDARPPPQAPVDVDATVAALAKEVSEAVRTAQARVADEAGEPACTHLLA